MSDASVDYVRGDVVVAMMSFSAAESGAGGSGTRTPSKRLRPKGVAPSPNRLGRGVLDGAFAVLDALASADNGLGLTALAGASGLAKTSAYRLAEQLVVLGAVQRRGHRYYVGARIGRIGQCWQPDPVLRAAAQSPVHTLAVQIRATASLRVLHGDSLRMICTTAPHGRAYIPQPADRESTARTATGRLLFAASAQPQRTLPDCWTSREWRRLRQTVRDMNATVIDHHDALPGVCCVSAPVWSPAGECLGAVTAIVTAKNPAPGLSELVVRAARTIEPRLR
jgi:DNA-binding IclR family transcriptional regulator